MIRKSEWSCAYDRFVLNPSCNSQDFTLCYDETGAHLGSTFAFERNHCVIFVYDVTNPNSLPVLETVMIKQVEKWCPNNNNSMSACFP
jgi:hypothetical protein